MKKEYNQPTTCCVDMQFTSCICAFSGYTPSTGGNPVDAR